MNVDEEKNIDEELWKKKIGKRKKWIEKISGEIIDRRDREKWIRGKEIIIGKECGDNERKDWIGKKSRSKENKWGEKMKKKGLEGLKEWEMKEIDKESEIGLRDKWGIENREEWWKRNEEIRMKNGLLRIGKEREKRNDEVERKKKG